eukprot:TRINITY_DN13580_c0_g1_i1.p1 TRINITY_DN13580_c0_g1~~TRINITY_DN13580_c0_g1_i1.p1  ORF type:complete len:750 (+),score=205.29 TRINITY_DN13580_c0_g1_i1:56-2251(+)
MLVRDDTEPSGEHFHRDYDMMTIEELRLELQTADERIVELGNQQEITDLFPQIESLQNEVNLLTEENERLTGLVRQNEKDDIITESIIEKTDIPTTLPSGEDNEQIKLLEEELDSLQSQLKTTKEANDSLQRALDNERLKLESERSELENEKAKRQMNINDVDLVEKENRQLKEDNEKLEKELLEMKDAQKRVHHDAQRKSALLEEELKKAHHQVEILDANNNASEGLNSLLAQERAKHERVSGKLKENTAALNSVKETLEKVNQENAKLKQSLIESQTTMDTMISQADLGIKSQKAQKKLKEQIATLTAALQQSEDEKIKYRKEFVRKQQKTDEIIGQHSRCQEKEKIYLADIKKLKNEIRQLKETVKTTDNSYLRAQVEELTISNGVLKEMVRSANINVRVAIAKGKTHRTESESTLHNQTKSVAMKQTPTKKIYHKDTLESPQQRVDIIRDRDQKLGNSPSVTKGQSDARPNENGRRISKEEDGFTLPPASPLPPSGLPPSVPTSPKDSEKSATRKSSSRGFSQQSATPTSKGSSCRDATFDEGSAIQSPSSRRATDGGKTPQVLGSETSSVGGSNSPTGSQARSSRIHSCNEEEEINKPLYESDDVKEGDVQHVNDVKEADGTNSDSDYCDDASVPSPRKISAVDVVDDDFDEVPSESTKEVTGKGSNGKQTKINTNNHTTGSVINTNRTKSTNKEIPKQKVPVRQRSTSVPRRVNQPKRKASKQRS